MVPDTDLQLQVVLKALQDVVAPALDPTNKAAHEQLGLAVATLAMIRSHLPLLNRRDRAELHGMITMAEAVRATGAEGVSTELLDSARVLLENPAADTAPLHQARAQLAQCIEAVVDSVEGGPLQGAVARAVVDTSDKPLRLARSWFQAAGFETGETLPAVETVLV